jgi:hypothetical protein
MSKGGSTDSILGFSFEYPGFRVKGVPGEPECLDSVDLFSRVVPDRARLVLTVPENRVPFTTELIRKLLFSMTIQFDEGIGFELISNLNPQHALLLMIRSWWCVGNFKVKSGGFFVSSVRVTAVVAGKACFC